MTAHTESPSPTPRAQAGEPATWMERSFFVPVAVMTFAGVIRTALETAWGHFPPEPRYLINTIVYVYLMVIAEGYLIHVLLNGEPAQLRRLIQRGSIWITGLFVEIPLLNMVFHKYLFQWPIWYRIEAPFPVFPHYGPVGIHVAFALVVFALPFALRTIYAGPMARIFAATLPVYAAHYLVYYQATMPLHTHAWSVTFLVPILIVFRNFTNVYATSMAERRRLHAFHALMWISFLALCYLSLP